MLRFKFIIKSSLFFLVLLSFSSFNVYAEDSEFQKVTVAEAFIEFHTGPGRGFPVFHIVERGEQIQLIKKKTQWFKIRSPKGLDGWVHEDTMQETLIGEDEFFDADNSDFQSFSHRNIEVGVMGGDFGGATSLTLYGGWNFTENLTAELSVAQALGNVADIRYANASLLHQPFPEWRFSPFLKLGAGVIQTRAFTTLVQAEDRNDVTLLAGLGMKMYVSRQFFVRLEYISYTILTSRNDNDEVKEWKLGFSVFF